MCASLLVLMPSLFPGFAQSHRRQRRGKINTGPARTKPKQEHPRSSDLNPVDRKTSFPTHRGRKEYSLLVPDRCTCSIDANS